MCECVMSDYIIIIINELLIFIMKKYEYIYRILLYYNQYRNILYITKHIGNTEFTDEGKQHGS